MDIAIVTGSGGLIGAQTVRYFSDQMDLVVGVDNDMRSYFFGDEASTRWAVDELETSLGNYEHRDLDIRDRAGVAELFSSFGSDIELVVHTAAQPSHDWAAKEPFTDFDVNATGTLNLLEATRSSAPDAVFIFTSTNKVYGDTPNRLPLVELEQRWELDADHPWHECGIPEEMSLDNSVHSLFGASKVAADVMCQEYGRYFGLKTGTFRGGCLTGPGHSGAQLHGFLAYLMKCTVTGEPYTVFGYKGKQVRDNIHADDLVGAFDAFRRDPRPGEAYNIGGGREANCSMVEAIQLCQEIAGRELDWTYTDDNRIGDHIWWISDINKFKDHFPSFKLQYDLRGILEDIHRHGRDRWQAS
ncbi:MAG: NAD-dependent epimerase/dehydratase family protein [Acidimicrobiia bacterium]|nr:NAD-dependent epimerase/dehydratase family protein [Acidimicrobiia bacterium]